MKKQRICKKKLTREDGINVWIGFQRIDGDFNNMQKILKRGKFNKKCVQN
jgi:hypothetical protein